MADALNLAFESDADEESQSTIPFQLPLDLVVRDPDTIAELFHHAEGDDRDQFALSALRIGVLALKQARGQVDADAVRRESERMIDALESRLGEHSRQVHDRLAASLKEYFDPSDGRFQERVERLVKQDGELETVIRRQIGAEDSELARTLSAHFGEASPLMKLLSPDQSRGLLATLRETVDEQLKTQREHVLSQFSLDNKDGALARFISELTTRQEGLTTELHEKIDRAVQEFSLDDEESALSRLVRNVESAQRTITNEFSLDDEQSALARLKRELTGMFEEHREHSRKFQEEVVTALAAMNARKAEAARSTRHGLEFETAVFEFVQGESQRVGDVATAMGHLTGNIKNCKVGDCVIDLGPDCAAPGARIVIEAKEKDGYNLIKAREEIETARKNRSAEVGVFIYSSKTAPGGIEPLCRCGDDVIVVWNVDDSSTDLYLKAALSLAKALCVRASRARDGQAADFTDIDRAILEIEKRATSLDEVATWAKTIHSNSEKIMDKVTTTRKALEKQVETLREKIDDVKSATQGE